VTLALMTLLFEDRCTSQHSAEGAASIKRLLNRASTADNVSVWLPESCEQQLLIKSPGQVSAIKASLRNCHNNILIIWQCRTRAPVLRSHLS
jgi:hypothetical protein